MGTLGPYSVHIIRSAVLAYAFRSRKSGLIKQDKQFFSVFNELDAQNLFDNKFYFMPLHVEA